jgi:YegS/Rv2252/BmrU family lipid kinase
MLVITNAEAGTSDAERLEEALEVLRTRCSVDVAATSNPGELDGVLQRAGSRPIVVAGGDGSLHAVVQALHRRGELAGKTLALLPLGTGNDFARGAGIPLEPTEAARVVLDGEARPVDLLVDETGAVVVNNVHVGMGALAARRGKRWKERLGSVGVGHVNLGRLGYPIGTLMSAFRPPYLKLRVEVDGVEVNPYGRPVLMVAVGNGANVGGGTPLTPEADPEDGAADVMVSRAVTPAAKAGYVLDLALRRHTERDDVLELRGRRVKVTGEEFWVSADGELYGPERSREWRVLRAAFRMVLPSA